MRHAVSFAGNTSSQRLAIANCAGRVEGIQSVLIFFLQIWPKLTVFSLF
jgi:hypothetical protein